MSEDELLRNLGQVAREQAGRERLFLDERWDRLAAGTLSAEEDAELRRLAETSDEARVAYEAFRPLGAAFHARIVAKIAERRAVEEANEAVPRRVIPASVPLRVVPAPVPRPKPFRLRTWGSTAAAMAATWAALLFGTPQFPMLTLAVAGGARLMRGEAAETPTWAPGDPFQAIVSPTTAFAHVWPLRTRVYLLRGAEIRPVEAHAEVEPGGVVKVTGTLDRDLPAGTWTLWVVVGRWGTLPGAAKLGTLSAAHPQNDRHWVAMPQTLNVRPREPG